MVADAHFPLHIVLQTANTQPQTGPRGQCLVRDETYGFTYDMSAVKAARGGQPMIFNQTKSADPFSTRVYTLNPICGGDAIGLTIKDFTGGSYVSRELTQSRTMVMTEDRNAELHFSSAGPQGAGMTCKQPQQDGTPDDDADDNMEEVAFTGVVRFVCTVIDLGWASIVCSRMHLSAFRTSLR
jgi:hypothetical protein